MREATVRTTAGSARVGVRVTVNDVEMHETTAYLSDATTVPVGLFGTEDELEYAVEVSFPSLPLLPHVESRTVAVE
jgi:hypothetical protein